MVVFCSAKFTKHCESIQPTRHCGRLCGGFARRTGHARHSAHLPLYHQTQIYSRQGVDLDRFTLADWVGRAALELRPIHGALMADLKRSTKLFMDETRAPVLGPGARKAQQGYFWALACDDRTWSGTAPPGVVFTYAPVGADNMQNEFCWASAASCRSTVMPDTTG